MKKIINNFEIKDYYKESFKIIIYKNLFEKKMETF